MTSPSPICTGPSHYTEPGSLVAAAITGLSRTGEGSRAPLNHGGDECLLRRSVNAIAEFFLNGFKGETVKGFACAPKLPPRSHLLQLCPRTDIKLALWKYKCAGDSSPTILPSPFKEREWPCAARFRWWQRRERYVPSRHKPVHGHV